MSVDYAIYSLQYLRAADLVETSVVTIDVQSLLRSIAQLDTFLFTISQSSILFFRLFQLGDALFIRGFVFNCLLFNTVYALFYYNLQKCVYP